MKASQRFLIALISAIGDIATILINSFIIQLCWNFFVPAVSTLPQISFTQALILGLGVRALAGIGPSISKKG